MARPANANFGDSLLHPGQGPSSGDIYGNPLQSSVISAHRSEMLLNFRLPFFGSRSRYREIARVEIAPTSSSRRENNAPSSMPASLPPSLLGMPLPHIQAAGCIYMDYNGTTPIFPEVCA